MSVIRIASRYAKSLLDLALEQNKLDTVLEDIEAFNTYLENRDLFLLLKSPIINVSKKQQIFKALFEGKFDALTISFFDIIIRKSREKYLPDISREFINQYRGYKEITTAILITATEMSTDKVDLIKKALLESEITEKELELEMQIDPSIIGGFVIKIGDKLYDASISHKLDQLKKEFSGSNL